MTLSKERLEEERLEEIANLPVKIAGWGAKYAPAAHATVESYEIVKMARELLERRERDKQEPVAWTNQRSLDVRDKIVAFTCKESADEYGSKSAWSDVVPLYAAPPAQPAPVAQPELTVWYGAMPESNGKTNWTAILRRKDDGCRVFTIDCSEYPDRVRYEADRMRWMIGELPEEPDILAYDAHAHSGYVKPGNSPVTPDGWVACSERMPSNGERDIWLFDGEFVHHGYIWNGNDFVDWNEEYASIKGITHWMKMVLPAAPQQEEGL